MENIDKSDLFLSVVQSNKGIIYKVANSYCKDIEDRKDLVQEIIIQLWLYKNHKLENLDKKWFRNMIAGSGGKPVLEALAFYKEMEAFKKE